MELDKHKLEQDFTDLFNQLIKWREELTSNIPLKTEDEVIKKRELWNKYNTVSNIIYSIFGIEYNDFYKDTNTKIKGE